MVWGCTFFEWPLVGSSFSTDSSAFSSTGSLYLSKYQSQSAWNFTFMFAFRKLGRYTKFIHLALQFVCAGLEEGEICEIEMIREVLKPL